jgi:hypothetical protein
MLPNLKDLLLLSSAIFIIRLTRTYVDPIHMLAISFRIKKPVMFVLTKLVNRGFSSIAPKYRVPTTVVIASIEPIRIIIKLGSTSRFSLYIKPSPFFSLL